MVDIKRTTSITIETNPITKNHKNSSGIILPVSAFANEKQKVDNTKITKNGRMFFFTNILISDFIN
jgi:hypothetical protein